MLYILWIKPPFCSSFCIVKGFTMPDSTSLVNTALYQTVMAQSKISCQIINIVSPAG